VAPRHLLDEILDDVRGGHNIVSTAFIECGAMWKTDGPEASGFALLAFEAWCYHRQIPDVTVLARAFPDTTIILDHFGGPVGVGSYAGRAREV
jgi:predicted TIM-barrel fold metal-dependent hydrolase